MNTYGTINISGYRILEKIGKGGIAVAYRATQESLERDVVLKILDLANILNHESRVDRFLSEARIIASINHSNIITIYDMGISDNYLFIAMEYAQGGDLESSRNRMTRPVEILDIILKITNGLVVAHQHGIVHRDVKPANILFRDDDVPVLTDFGIALQVDKSEEYAATEILIGSPVYMSPEQARGERVDERTDIYSLGCVLYEMLTGKRVYAADTLEMLIEQHQHYPVPSLPSELDDFQPLINKMMAKDRNDRFDNSLVLQTYLNDFIRKPGFNDDI